MIGSNHDNSSIVGYGESAGKVRVSAVDCGQGEDLKNEILIIRHGRIVGIVGTGYAQECS
jgi:hypothetical protein